MKLLYARCAGLDVHQKVIVACVRIATDTGEGEHQLATFGTTVPDLVALSAWLTGYQVTHVAMEATGVYWKPVWHVLETDFTLILANAQHIRNLPNRKSDVNDATWIADLLAHGLIRSSFVPPAAIYELRDLTRTRKQLSRETAQHTLRLQKVLEDANLKLTEIVTDILGLTGRAILQALIAGEQNAERLADYARSPRLKASRAEFVAALQGRVTAHHRFLLKLHLDQITALEAAVRTLDARLGEMLAPFRHAVTRLITIPGVGDVVAQVIVAEIGIDMERFPSAGHLLSWAGLCPGLRESAGKRLPVRTRRGGWLKTMLVQAAWAAVRRPHTYLHAQFVRLRSRRGPKKAILAVAASILTAAYHMLKHDVPYADLGSAYFERRDKAHVANRLIRRLQHLGFTVQVAPAA